MPMRQPPAVTIAPEYQGHAQGPVLVGQTTDLAVLAFDQHQYGQVARYVGLHQLYLRLAGSEEAGYLLQGAVGGVEAVPGRAAEGRQQRVVLGVPDQTYIAAHVSANERDGGVRAAADQIGDVLFGDALVRHDPPVAKCGPARHESR